MRTPAFIAALLLAAVLSLSACGSDDGDKGTVGSQGATSPNASAAPKGRTAPPAPGEPPSCQRVARPAPRDTPALPKPRVKLSPAKRYSAVVSTSCGQFTIALAVKQAPKTASSFAYLAGRGFYDGLAFHRISPGFVIQGGDPKGDGSGGPGYSVTEPPPANLRYTRGTVAMAKTETEPPGTSGSQFFIVTAPSASDAPFSLPSDYALVGRVTKGLDVVRFIGDLEANPQTERPNIPVVIRSVRITQG